MPGSPIRLGIVAAPKVIPFVTAMEKMALLLAAIVKGSENLTLSPATAEPFDDHDKTEVIITTFPILE